MDEALQVEMNCSANNWFASANYIEQIPAPIRSRLNIYTVEAPNVEQQCLIARSVYSDLISDHLWGIKFEKSLDNAVIDKLVELSARRQKSALLNACSEVAFREGPKSNQLLQIKHDDIKIIPDTPKKRSMGFY